MKTPEGSSTPSGAGITVSVESGVGTIRLANPTKRNALTQSMCRDIAAAAADLDARTDVDVVVVGSGPNGLAAAVTMARAGLAVQVYEAQPTIGGGARTLDLGLTDVGLRHDLCSAVHPLALAGVQRVEKDLVSDLVEVRQVAEERLRPVVPLEVARDRVVVPRA